MTKRTTRIETLKIIFIANIINSILFLFTSFMALANWHDYSSNNILFLSMINVCWILIVLPFNIYIYYRSSIKLNKREKSALLSAPLLSLFGVGVFVIYNAWKKSGLSLKQKEEAIERIQISKVDSAISKDNVLKNLKPKVLEKINMLLEIAKENLETQENVNAFILDTLKDEGITLKIDINDAEILQVGYNL